MRGSRRKRRRRKAEPAGCHGNRRSGHIAPQGERRGSSDKLLLEKDLLDKLLCITDNPLLQFFWEANMAMENCVKKRKK